MNAGRCSASQSKHATCAGVAEKGAGRLRALPPARAVGGNEAAHGARQGKVERGNPGGHTGIV